MYHMPLLLVSVHKESSDIFFPFEIYICCPEKMQMPHPWEVKAKLGWGSDQDVNGVPAHDRSLELNDT